MMTEELLLELKDIHVSYGSIAAIKGICLEVYRGEVVTLLGANGAGKTTTMRTISRLLKAKSGSILFKGSDITNVPAHKIVAMGISHSPEGRRVFGTLTVKENLALGSYTRKQIDPQRLAWVYELFPRLQERSRQLAGTMSGGEQQMLAIGRALMSKPELLLLDEPSLGIAPILVKEIFRQIRQIADSGVTVLIVEQNARAALKLADRGYVLEVGKIVFSGTSGELLGSAKIQEAYLGKKKHSAKSSGS
ncbi:ABC transporter ATP-binding protein [Desulfobacter hydrogenophilus]|uniref:ABC transporter ATP-binding protein n=2 Tax=Desulfobacter hydrogenophilus TaxID=2291 RepID=A0A328FFP7_9BACT|nr:ABC transporter ATP-binding protein [Desulfobacter hydrogenophilus]NDY70853.1 ABC transporter ATP-binding protein [Desulfobacter hydrogenophilus]QBH11624.1 ABC transporter ATP-binding protein [Desulfobacter hydrogenophilus]RAM03169.1 ABC transporter ATP-binding protein [Desulfobacter hydrogenophilus]